MDTIVYYTFLSMLLLTPVERVAQLNPGAGEMSQNGKPGEEMG